MLKIQNFDVPMQVTFKSENDHEWHGGIGYNDVIICGCCGGIVPLDELEDVQVFDWINIEEAIIGDEAPEGVLNGF